MSLHEKTRWIVTYDIHDPRCGVKVHRLLAGWGLPLQYSVFVVPASAAELQQLMQALDELIDPVTDDVRAYRWPEQAEVHLLGRPLLPDEVLLGPPAKNPAAPARRRVRRSALA